MYCRSFVRYLLWILELLVDVDVVLVGVDAFEVKSSGAIVVVNIYYYF